MSPGRRRLKVRLAYGFGRPVARTSREDHMPGILLATHGSETSDAAVRVAARLAERKHTTLSAVCVLEPARIVDGGYAAWYVPCLLYTSPSPRDGLLSRMPSSAGKK